MKKFFKQMLAMAMCFAAVSFIACSEDNTEPTPGPEPNAPESYYQVGENDAVEIKSTYAVAEGNSYRVLLSSVEGLTSFEDFMQFDENGVITNPIIMIQVADALVGEPFDLTATEDAWDYYQVMTNIVEPAVDVNMYDASALSEGTLQVTISEENKIVIDLDATTAADVKIVVKASSAIEGGQQEDFDEYIAFNDEEVEVMSVYMEQDGDKLLIFYSPEEGLETYDDFIEWAPGTTSYMHEFVSITMPISALNTEIDLTNPEGTTLYTNLSCFEQPIEIKSSNELQPITEGGLLVFGDGEGNWSINAYFALADESIFDSYCVGYCEVNQGGGDSGEEGLYGYISFDGEKVPLNSAAFVFNEIDTEDFYGLQYAVALSPEEGLMDYESIAYADESVYFSIDAETLYTAEAETDNVVNVMNIGEDNQLYAFWTYIGDYWYEDMGMYHEDMVSGEVVFTINPDTYEATLEALYVTADGVEIKILATAPYMDAGPAMLEDNFIRYFWGEYTPGDKEIATAFAQETAEGVTYTLCAGDIQTYADLENTTFFRFFVPGKKIGDTFEIDMANTDEAFECRLFDPIEGMDKTISKDNRENIIGTLMMYGWNIACDFTYTDPAGESYNDIVMMTDYKKQIFRDVNECVETIEGERELAFTPKSVVYDRSGDTHKIYISSAPGISTVMGMAEAEVVVAYPASAYDKVSAGQFISGSNCPEMTIAIAGETYNKTTEGINGLNLVVNELTAEKITLNTNLYTSEGGMALYYTGKCTSIE